MRNGRVLDGANIGYAPGRTMECRALRAGTHESFNFLEGYDESSARDYALQASRSAAQVVLARRSEPITDALPWDDMGDVYEYVADVLGMEPMLGRLALVADRANANSSGATTYNDATSLVYRNRVEQNFDENEVVSPELKEVINALRINSVIAHELAHLAGLADLTYFEVDESSPSQPSVVKSAGPNLCDEPIGRNGSYFEEGFGSLVGAIHYWHLASQEGLHIPAGTNAYRSPSGTLLHLPERINFAGHHEYTFPAWGIEQLVSIEPRVWDVLIASRKYGARSSVVRPALQLLLDGIETGLFDRIDTVNVDNLDETMEATERINHLTLH